MRWLFLILLLLNAVYVGWELLRQPEPVKTASTANTNVPRLELVNEKLLGDITGGASDNQVANSGGASANNNDGNGKNAGGSIPEIRSASGNNKSKPLAEACYTLGPFRELRELSNFTRAIKDYVAEATYRSRDEQEQAMFWVFIDPVGDREQARKVNAELHKKSIKDTYIINSGPKNNGISLGHYREKSRAYKHAKRISGLGFVPVVEPVFRTYTIYWLDYRVAPGKTIPEEVLNSQLTRKVSQFDRPCA